MRARTLLKRAPIAAALLALAAPAPAHAAPARAAAGTTTPAPVMAPRAAVASCDGNTVPYWCTVPEPVVNQPTAVYPIWLNKGDRIRIDAGGCVQTGGRGKTWKRYVDPASDKGIYHGLIQLPGTDMERIADSAHRDHWLSAGGNLVLGYEDDGYSDNGYWGHDDGTGGQCRGVGNAWITISVYAHDPFPTP